MHDQADRPLSVSTSRRPADCLLGLALLLLALLPALSGISGSGNRMLVIRSAAGEWRYRLDTPRRLVLPGVSGQFVIMVSNRHALVVESHCPDQRCLRMGPISRGGQAIVCLPQQIEVGIDGDGEHEVDAVCE